MQIYNKLVRDNIPQIIENNGEKPITRVLDNDEYGTQLKTKLQEEVNEFLQDESIEELADILEVMHGLLQYKGKTFDDLEKVRKDKFDKRGGFAKKIFLERVED